MPHNITLNITAEISADLDIIGLKEAIAMRLEDICKINSIQISENKGVNSCEQLQF